MKRDEEKCGMAEKERRQRGRKKRGLDEKKYKWHSAKHHLKSVTEYTSKHGRLPVSDVLNDARLL